jgi:hypothetical protein
MSDRMTCTEPQRSGQQQVGGTPRLHGMTLKIQLAGERGTCAQACWRQRSPVEQSQGQSYSVR